MCLSGHVFDSLAVNGMQPVDLLNDSARLTEFLQRREPQYLENLRQLCAIESPTGYAPGINAMCDWVQAWCRAEGLATERYPDVDAGDSLVVAFKGAYPGPRILLAAHLDTVYSLGIAAQRPLVRQDDRLLAPGVADNKSGLLSGLYAMAAIAHLGLGGGLGAITLVCGSDEETDMRASLRVLRGQADCHDLALVLEAGRENGDIVAARKTSAHFVLEVQGREAHAGVEPDKGANAVWAIARHIVALQALHGSRPGLTLNVGLVQGGTRVNVVPGYARAEIDVRAVQQDDLQPITEALERIAATVEVQGTSATLLGGWKAPPMPRTPEISALAELASECALDLGFTVSAAATGGVSYANYLAGFGLPVLDGLGPIGGLDHSPLEYIAPESIVPRTALLALLLVRCPQISYTPRTGD